MARLSDILKGLGVTPLPRKVKEKKLPEPLSSIPQVEVKRVDRRVEESKAGKARQIYQEAALFMERLWRELKKDQPISGGLVRKQVIELVDAFFSIPRIMLAPTRAYVDDNYLYQHSVNVCLYAVSVGSELGYRRNKLINLGLGALLHDVGMSQISEEIFLKPGELSPEEWGKIKEHPIKGHKLLKGVKEINPPILASIFQHHERLMGGGYPRGLKGDEIHDFAKIVGLVDSYDAMIHTRVYEEMLSPYEALKELIGLSDTQFANQVIKAFINQMGIFPLQSIVELNTGEIGRTKEIHRNFPMRPTIEIILDREGDRLKEPHTVILSKQRLLSVKRTISEEELHQRLHPPLLKAQGRKKILIIEHSIHTNDLLERYLKKDNLEIITARDGGMGLERVKTEKPDLIILDIMLPKLDGYQVCRRIRDNPETKEIPIIGISGKISEEDVEKVYGVGMNDYMVKPFDIYELRRRVLNRLISTDERRYSGVIGNGNEARIG